MKLFSKSFRPNKSGQALLEKQHLVRSELIIIESLLYELGHVQSWLNFLSLLGNLTQNLVIHVSNCLDAQFFGVAPFILSGQLVDMIYYELHPFSEARVFQNLPLRLQLFLKRLSRFSTFLGAYFVLYVYCFLSDCQRLKLVEKHSGVFLVNTLRNSFDFRAL